MFQLDSKELFLNTLSTKLSALAAVPRSRGIMGNAVFFFFSFFFKRKVLRSLTTIPRRHNVKVFVFFPPNISIVISV